MWLTAVLVSTVLAAEKPKLAVLDVQPVGAKTEEAVALGEAMAQELSRRGFFDVISSSEIRTLLGVERQKQLPLECFVQQGPDLCHRTAGGQRQRVGVETVAHARSHGEQLA